VTVVGGDNPDAVVALLAGLTPSPGCALIVTCDSKGLAQRLATEVDLPVTLVDRISPLSVDRVFVLAADASAVIRDGQIVVEGTLRVGRVDRLLRSLAESVSRDAIAVLVAGAGADGINGIKRVKENGGVVLVEEPAVGPEGELGRAALATGVVDQTASRADLPLRLLALREIDRVTPETREEDAADMLRDILTLVRIRTGHDFSSYKRATLYRRVARRMQICQAETIGGYLHHLRERPEELSHLLHDFLISVTNFFRDPEAWQALERDVIPKLFADRGPSDHVRAWVAGCATGEEAYTLGILLLEHARTLASPPRLQIFATDIDDDALAEARAGRYPETIEVDVSPERRVDFFVREGQQYRVSTELREMILFSQHSLLRDPPFSRLDLVSCRNLMIYLNREAQARVLSVFHFALKPEGRLFLGSSESADSSSMFLAADPRYRIFDRRSARADFGIDTMLGANRWVPPNPVAVPSIPTERTASLGELHYRLVERYAPPSILVNGDMDVVHVSEHAGRYLEMGAGEPTRSVLRLVIPPLRLDLRTAIYATRQTRATDTRRVTFTDGESQRTIEMRVRAIDLAEVGPNAVLLYLDEIETPPEGATPLSPNDKLIEPVVREIEDELHRTRDQLRTTIEQYETSLEELKASNEELQAINEELRSASEELETSKEELQSVNEELTTLNHELKVKVDEVSHANSDLQNLMTSTDIGVVFLDRAMNLKRFTPRALDLFNMIPSDTGRPLAHVTHRLDTQDIPILAQTVIETLRPVERDVTRQDGRRYLMRILPYRSVEDRIDGVVVTFIDVSDLRDANEAREKSEAALETSEARLGLALRGAPLVALSITGERRVTWGTIQGREILAGPLHGLNLFEPEWETRFVAACQTLSHAGAVGRVEVELWIEKQLFTYEFRLERTNGEVLALGFDVTPRKREENALIEADRRKDEFLATLSHELRGPLAPIKMALEMVRIPDLDGSKMARSHAIMGRQVDMLSSLVDELLDLTRVTQGKIELKKQSLAVADVVEVALEVARPLLSEHRHSVVTKIPEDLQVLADRGRLVQVFSNLFTNAAKYTPDDGSIEIHAALAGANVRIEVRDNGVGIRKEMLGHVFDLFAQGDEARARSRGGLGVGLNLVRRLVELHGGTVEAHSDGADEGSMFVITLPAAH
jgi:two-component system CheB/CheR fusion protein